MGKEDLGKEHDLHPFSFQSGRVRPTTGTRCPSLTHDKKRNLLTGYTKRRRKLESKFA